METEYPNVVARTVRHKCGGIKFTAVVENGIVSKDTKKECARFAEPGYTIEDITIEEARAAKWCDCE